MRPITLAAAQAAARAGDVVANCRAAAELVREAAARDAALVVFPELFLCGYDLHRIGRDSDGCDLRHEDPRLEPLQAACRESQTHVVVGASLAEPGGRRLAALVIDARGAIRGRYAKRHLWGPEQELFVAGEDAYTLELHGWKLGLGICIEASLPEHARAAARDGAMAYLTPSASERGAVFHAARARENGMYAVFSNHVGNGFCGHTAIYAPTGDCVTQLNESEPGLALAELDPSAIRPAD